MRNPLVTLNGFHRLLRKSIDDLSAGIDPARAAELRDRFQAAENAAGATIDVLENMLSFARKDAVSSVFDVGDAVEDPLRLLRAQLEPIPVRLEPASVRLLVKGARNWFRS